MMTILLTQTKMGTKTATPLGLGTSRLGAFWQGRGIHQGIKTVQAAVDLGVTHIDTADVYARGISERIVGQVVRRREDILVTTKVGLLKTPSGLNLARKHGAQLACPPRALLNGSQPETCFQSAYIEAAARRCLGRQNRSVLDVLLLHNPGTKDLRERAFESAMDRLVRDGLVNEWGASVQDEDAALAALELPGLTWLQIPANVTNQRVAQAVSSHPRSAGITVVALAALGDGELIPRTTAAGIPIGDSVAGLSEAAANLPAVTGVLLGTSHPEHMRENFAAVHRGVDTDTLSAIISVLQEGPNDHN